MDLVDRDRLAALIDACPVLAVCFVVPDLLQFACRDRGVLRPQFAAARIGVGLQRQQFALRADDLELVARAGANIRRKDFPNASVAAQPHHVAAAIPVVEVANDGDAAGVRRPDGKVKAVDALMLDRMSAHLVEEAQMRTFADEIVVHRPEHWPEAVGIGDHPFVVATRGAVADRLQARDLDDAGKETGIVAARQFADRLARQGMCGDSLGAWYEAAGDKAAVMLLQAEKGKGIAMCAVDDGLNFVRRRCIRLGVDTVLLRRFCHQALQMSALY